MTRSPSIHGRLIDPHLLLVKALAATCYSRLVVMELGLKAELPACCGATEFAFGPLEPGHAGAYARLIPTSTAGEVGDRLGRGSHGFGVWHDDRLVHVFWASSGRVRVPYLRDALTIRPGAVLIHDVYVAPAFRGRRLAALGMTHGLRWLRQAGYRRALLAVLPENRAGFKAPRRLGFRPTGVMLAAGIGVRRRTFFVSSRSLERLRPQPPNVKVRDTIG